jgi:hypothetical protein
VPEIGDRFEQDGSGVAGSDRKLLKGHRPVLKFDRVRLWLSGHVGGVGEPEGAVGHEGGRLDLRLDSVDLFAEGVAELGHDVGARAVDALFDLELIV